MKATLLVELLTEELPPKSLHALSEAFAEHLVSEIIKHRLKQPVPGKTVFATPRRLAVLVPDVLEHGPDSHHSVEGPSSANAKAVEGFARKHKVSPESLERRKTEKGEIVVANLSLPGVHIDKVLSEIVEQALRRLPVARLMRWGSGEEQFVRPVHGLVMLHGSRVVPGKVLGVESGRATQGHRFMSAGEIEIESADRYEATLKSEGKVIASFNERRQRIEDALRVEAAKRNGLLGHHADLLDEVTALVEYPAVYPGAFDPAFLEVPQECLVLTMRQNQKYFPLFDGEDNLIPWFLVVSNMETPDPREIIGGNQRVVRPRLHDARFFYDRDRKVRLADRLPLLEKIVYHRQLGTQRERVERLRRLCGQIARLLGVDDEAADRAALLAKADLVTAMVGEFPELQGVMGRYYARHDGEPDAVAQAIESHYWPRFAGDRVPQAPLACALALADKLDALAGLFGIGQHPTGDRDPFGLRRAALGVVRILVENELPLSLFELTQAAFKQFKNQVAADLETFIFDRFAGYLREREFSALQVEAVLCLRPAKLSVVPRQLAAVRAFQALPEAESLAAANKRVANILKQAEAKGEAFGNASLQQFREPAERALHDAIRAASARANPLFDRGDYAGYLKSFASLKAPVDTFFDKVMVMAEDASLRRGRLALLRDLRDAMNRVADISKLAA